MKYLFSYLIAFVFLFASCTPEMEEQKYVPTFDGIYEGILSCSGEDQECDGLTAKIQIDKVSDSEFKISFLQDDEAILVHNASVENETLVAPFIELETILESEKLSCGFTIKELEEDKIDFLMQIQFPGESVTEASSIMDKQ